MNTIKLTTEEHEMLKKHATCGPFFIMRGEDLHACVPQPEQRLAGTEYAVCGYVPDKQLNDGAKYYLLAPVEQEDKKKAPAKPVLEEWHKEIHARRIAMCKKMYSNHFTDEEVEELTAVARKHGTNFATLIRMAAVELFCHKGTWQLKKR